MLTNVRKICCVLLFALVAQASLFFSAAQAEPIRLAYSAISGAMASLWVAQDYGYFRRQGLDVQLLYIGGGSVVTQALIGGDVQFVRLGANSVVQASLRGAGLKMIGNTINTLVFSLMARPEIQTAKDLKGKKIGVTRLGGSTDFAFGSGAQKVGTAARLRRRSHSDGWHAATARRHHRRHRRRWRGVAADQLVRREAWPQGTGRFRRNRHRLSQFAAGNVAIVLGKKPQHGFAAVARLLRRHSSS